MSQQPPILSESPAPPVPPDVAASEKKKDKKDKKDKQERNRGIETMYRVTYQNHISLSQLADNKANMLMSINGLIISVMIAIVTRTGAGSWSLAPVLVLITGCMVSLGFAIIAARPRLNRSAVTIDQVRNETGNVLFFGNFTSMPLTEFQESLSVLMNDRRLLYAHLSRQLYLMGQSLTGKYRYLQIAYGAFLAGTALATALFVVMYATGRLNTLP
jgi:CHASE1-domain containing sensor protein